MSRYPGSHSSTIGNPDIHPVDCAIRSPDADPDRSSAHSTSVRNSIRGAIADADCGSLGGSNERRAHSGADSPDRSTN